MTTPETGLDQDALVAEASQRTGGLTDLGSPYYLENLGRYISSLKKDARLSAVGEIIAREGILKHTVNRLQYVNDRSRFPEIAQQKIVKPVFIVGLPRTGTTILHDILAQDPANRAPLTWEMMFPSPPPESATFETDPRIEACQAAFPESDELPGFKAMHPMGPRLTQECIMLMGETMCTPLFHCQFNVPTYQDWVDNEADFSHVYAFHKQQLQHLQSRHQGDRWVLKTGGHLWGLDHLLTTYPDARIVFTHRDPVESMTSYASLTSLVRTKTTDHVDRAEIAQDWTARLQKVVTRAMEIRAARDYPDALFYDMHFPDFVKDQYAVVENIYEAFGLPMSEEGSKRIRAFIDDNPKGKHGAHNYTPEEYGVDPAAVRHAFREYIDQHVQSAA